jgi:hypothetical protein
VATELDPDRLGGLVRIGVDEVSWKRHHDYLTLVTDHESGRIVWGKAGKDTATLDAFFAELGPERAENIEAASTDMGQAFPASIATPRPRLHRHLRAPSHGRERQQERPQDPILQARAQDTLQLHAHVAKLGSRVARAAERLVAQNLVIAAVVIAGLVIWDLAGHLPLPLGVAGHEGSTVLVGLNGLRLLRTGAWTRAR